MTAEKPKKVKTSSKNKRFPKGYVVEYMGTIDEKNIFIIWRPIKLGYKKFVVKLGSVDNLKGVKIIEEVLRCRDGGTTFITTERGKFYFPSPLKKEHSTFNGKVIKLYKI